VTPANRRRISRALGRLLGALLITLAWSTVQAAPPSWYDVELIVFANLDTSSAGDERWPVDPGTPTLDGAVELLDASGPDTVQPGLRLTFQRLTGKALQLNSEWARLRRSAAYHPLLHIAWRQPGLARAEARAVHLRTRAGAPTGGLQTSPVAPLAGGSEAPVQPVIDGTLRLYRARYLHLEVDLRYQPRVPPPGLDQAATIFRLTESRRVRSRKLYYFDNPLFGVLALVTPEPEPSAAEPATGQAAAPLPAATDPAHTAPAAP